MAWNDTPAPAGWINGVEYWNGGTGTNKEGNLFLLGEPLTFLFNHPSATSYTVRNYYGQTVATGSVTAGATSLTISALPVGWYKLYLDRVTSVAVYGTAIGMVLFSVIEHDASLVDPPASLNVNTVNPAFTGPDNSLRGASLMGPLRISITNAADPFADTGAFDQNVSRALGEHAYLTDWYLSHPDPARPRPLWVSFPNGCTGTGEPAGVTSAVEALYPTFEWFEGPSNEPDPAGAVPAMHTFHDAVKAGNAAAKVLGPCPVTVNGGELDGLNTFFAGGGGQYLDGFSFHTYNCVNGDITLGRKVMDGLVQLLTQYGMENLPRFQTEYGTFAASFGVFDVRTQARWAMMHRFIMDQYSVPKERDFWYYDLSAGYWDYASFWKLSDGSTTAMLPMYRVYSREVFGKQWAERLDFGTVENDHYIGSRFVAATGESVLALLGGGRTDGSIRLQVTGDTRLEVVSAFGAVSTIAAVNGVVTVPVGLEPVYVRVPENMTATVEQVLYGENLTRWGVRRTDAAGADVSKIANGVLENFYYKTTYPYAPTEFRDTADLPADATIELRDAHRFDTAVTHCPTPWQDQGALLDFDLEYRDTGGTWHVLDTVTEPINTVAGPAPAANTRCFYDTYYSGRCIFVHEFDPVVGDAVRIVVRDATSGGVADADAAAAGGQSGSRKIRVRELAVYCRETQTPQFLGAV